MSFPRYPEYKDSGVEWLGKVPKHWTVCALSYRYEVALGKMLDEKKYTGEHPAPYLRNVDVQWGRINTDDLPQMDFKDDDLERYSLKPGDLLVCEGGEVGRAAVWAGQLAECYYQKALHRLRAKCEKNDLASFFFYTLNTAAKLEVFSGAQGKSTIAHLTAEAFRRYLFAFPPRSEQLLIQSFLTREITKLDNLMAEQEKLIALLKEKRQAVIAHAVTTGLDPTVPMKDSGVEWLGEIPSHWEVSQLKHVAQDGTSITYGIVQAGPHVEGGIPYIKTSDMSGESLPLEGYSRTSSEIDQSYSRSKVFFGDLVIAIRASVGKCLPLPEELDGANLTQGTAKISPGEYVERDYLLHLINSAGLQIYFDSMAKGATFKEITLDMLRRTPVLIPPLAEQRDIARYLSTELKSFQNLLQETEKAISLLKERRTALISAAVTGKIDVRGLVKDEQEQAA